MPQSPRRDPLSDDALLDVVAHVALTARPDMPADVPMAAYNAARASSAFPDAITAEAAWMRFGGRLSWSEIVALALSRPESRRAKLTAALRSEEAPWLTEYNDGTSRTHSR